MKSILILFCCFVAVLAYNSTEFEEWQSFKAKFRKVYSQKEDLQRYHQFLKTKTVVQKHNNEYENGKQTYHKGINYFADWSDEEILQFQGKPLPGITYRGVLEDFVDPKVDDIPDSFDWRDKGAVTHVKDQGACSVCWAFASVATLEAQMYLKTGKLVALSEQNLVDCVQGGACNQNFVAAGYFGILGAGGIASEEEYPYLGVDSPKGKSCPKWDSPAGYMSKFYILPAHNETLMKIALATRGPLFAAMDASSTEFARYSGGVFFYKWCRKRAVTHAVTIVGYGTEDGQDYWLVKNSYGDWWGEKGYFKIARNRDSHCGIGFYNLFPEVE